MLFYLAALKDIMCFQMQNDPKGRSQKAACRPQSTNKAWVVPHLLLGSEHAAAELGWPLCSAPCWFSAPSGTGAVAQTCPHLNNLGWDSADLHLRVWYVGIDIWSSQPERAAFIGHSSSDLFLGRYLLCNKSPPKCLFLPSDYTGSLQQLAQTRQVLLKPSRHRACVQPFSWNLAKGLLWLGISDNWSTRACAICSCGCLLLKCYFHYGVAIWVS